MNHCVTGWHYFSNPRMFPEYGRQKGWERKTPATGFHKIFLAGILPIFLGNQAYKDIRYVQLAVKNCGNMNLCFRFVVVTEQMELPF